MGGAFERFESALDSSVALTSALREAPFPLGIREVRGDDVIHLLDNAAMAALFGKSPEQLVGKGERELGVDPDLIERAIKLLRRARARELPAKFELTFGITQPLALLGIAYALPLSDQGEELYMILAQDVSELRKLQADVLELDRMASVGVFAASIAHEIMNPATALRFLGERAAQGVAKGDLAEVAVALEGIREGTEQIIAVTHQLRSFSTPRARPSEVVSLEQIVSSVLMLAGAQLRSDATIAVDSSEDVCVVGDPVQLRQLVLNLLFNAVRAASHVRLRIARAENDRALLEITDDGPGFPAERLSQPFAPFEPGNEGGSGLGLYVCKRITDGHGGTIELANRADGGAQVSVLLPAVTSEPP
jgi:C4-dicarboxylate-specific signal transduction histidine kinase